MKRPLILGATLLLAVGCPGDDSPPASDGSGTQGPSTDTTDGETDPGQTGPIDTTGPDPDSGSDSSTGEPDDCAIGGDALVCQPMGTTAIAFEVTSLGTEIQEQTIEETCTIVNLVNDGTNYALALNCPTQPVEITITTFPFQGGNELLTEMMDVDLFYSATMADKANTERNLGLRWPGGGSLILAAFDGAELPTAEELDLSPLVVSVPESDCETFSTEFPCIEIQRSALVVEYDGVTAEVWSNQDAYVGQLTSYRVMTDRVQRIQCFGDDCGFNYYVWYVQGMVFQIPEG